MTTVFIPTRARADLLKTKTLPKWEGQKVNIVLVVEKWEYGRHKQLAKQFSNVDVMRLPKTNQGINYARNFIVKYADLQGYRHIIMADDDIFPNKGSDVRRLKEIDKLPTLGMGIMVPFYGLMFGNQTIKNEDRPLMSLNALGKRLFSLDVGRVIEVGNFNPSLHSGWGDDELVRDGMYGKGYNWYVHAGVMGTSASNRYTKGGINDFHHEDLDSRMAGQLHSHKYIFGKWGRNFVSNPYTSTRFFFQWKKFMDIYTPNWRARIDWVKE